MFYMYELVVCTGCMYWLYVLIMYYLNVLVVCTFVCTSCMYKLFLLVVCTRCMY